MIVYTIRIIFIYIERFERGDYIGNFKNLEGKVI